MSDYIKYLLSVLGMSILAIFGWGFNLSNRVTAIEQKQMDIPDLLDAKFDSVNFRLERIERALNGYMKGH